MYDETQDQRAAIRMRLNVINQVLAESEGMIKRSPTGESELDKFRTFDANRNVRVEPTVDRDELER